MKTKAVLTTCMALSGLLLFGFCNLPGSKAGDEPDKVVKKPSSTYNDSLEVPPFSAVFYEPDSLQLEKLKLVTTEQVFKGSMHEYEYQVKYARQFLNEQRKELRVINSVHARYLVFKNKEKVVAVIDLDNYDPVGMFVFDGSKPPQPVDMMNVETQVSMYFDNDIK